eukprot:gene8057-8252_t
MVGDVPAAVPDVVPGLPAVVPVVPVVPVAPVVPVVLELPDADGEPVLVVPAAVVEPDTEGEVGLTVLMPSTVEDGVPVMLVLPVMEGELTLVVPDEVAGELVPLLLEPEAAGAGELALVLVVAVPPEVEGEGEVVLLPVADDELVVVAEPSATRTRSRVPKNCSCLDLLWLPGIDAGESPCSHIRHEMTEQRT